MSLAWEVVLSAESLFEKAPKGRNAIAGGRANDSERRPRSSPDEMWSPEGAEYPRPLFRPFRAHKFFAVRSGGVAPGYFMSPLQGFSNRLSVLSPFLSESCTR